MRIGIIIGSHRDKSESSRMGAYLARRLEVLSQQVKSQVQIDTFDLRMNPLPLWDEGVWQKSTEWQKIWGPWSERLQACQGFVVISPEWGGMVPPGLKNFLLLCSPKELGHKPAIIVTISASRNGAYPVSELRSSGYKNNYLVYLPEHLILRDVKGLFASATPENETDIYMRKRADHVLMQLLIYAPLFETARAQSVMNLKDYATGM